MRILFVHSGADLYGASRSLLRLIARLQCDGHEAVVVLPYEGPLLELLRAQDVRTLIHRSLPIVTRPAVRSPRGLAELALNIPRSTHWLGALIREFRPDVVHTNTALILTPGLAARLANIPHVWHVREFFSEFPSFWKKYQWYMDAFADRIVCVSSAVAEQFHPKIRRRKVAVIHDGFPQSGYASFARDATSTTGISSWGSSGESNSNARGRKLSFARRKYSGNDTRTCATCL
jgi:glycosyltransferase involved in cell wall biosynthesis